MTMSNTMKAGNAQAMDGDFWSFAKIGGGMGIGGLLMFLATYFAGRSDASQHGAFKLISALEVRLQSVTERLDKAEHELDECTKKHADQAEEMATLRAQLGIKSVIAQEAAKVAAVDSLARKDRDA